MTVRYLFTNVSLFDGSGAAPAPGEVLTDGERIAAIARGGEELARDGATVIDGNGGTLMPGLIDGHTHLAFPFSVTRSPPVKPAGGSSGQRQLTPEASCLVAAYNAGVMLDNGYTSAYSGGAGSLVMDIAVRDEVDRGYTPGPRFRAAGQEGEDVSKRHNAALHGAGQSEDADKIRNFVASVGGAGASICKFVLSGPSFMQDFEPMYSDELLTVAREEADKAGVWLTAHCRPLGTIRQALEHGFRVLYHCDHFDEATLDLAEARKEEIFIGPSVGSIAERVETETPAPFPTFEGLAEIYARWMPELVKRGIRMVPGGDYGFPKIPHGRNARDLEYMVRYFGISPMDALLTATRNGGELMDLEVGQIRENWLADLILVDGDPLADITLVANREKMPVVMKGGALHRAPEPVAS